MSEGTGTLNLSAVLRADMVSSTELLTKRGVDAAIEMRQRSRSIVEQTCTSGRLLEVRGDGTVIGFMSAVAALEAAWRLQTELRGTQDFRLRVAVTLEELTFGEVLSTSVQHRTQSIESRCPPGGVIVDGRIRSAVRGHDGPKFEAFDDDLDELVSFDVGTGRTPATSSVQSVLFSDIATSEVSDLGAATSAAQEISQRCIAENNGVILDSNGAGHVAAFTSCAAAVRAATAMHSHAASSRARTDVRGDLALCIGVSIGDVVISDGAGFGVAIVEAARMHEQADAGVTLVSRDALELAGSTLAESDSSQPVMFKGLADPIDVIRIEHGTGVPPLLDLPPVFQRDQRFAMAGRDDGLALIQRRWDETLTGLTSAVLVSGEEGVGKTRLVRELARSVYGAGAIILHGACDEDLREPYAPIVQALSRAASLDPLLGAAVSDGSGPLGVLLGPNSSGEPEEVAPSQLELFDGVADAFERLSIARPLLLVIDDIQWGERDTVRLVDHILEALDSSRLLVVATCRAEALGSAPAAQDFIGMAGPAARVDHLRLERLDAADVVAMLESRTNSRLSGDEADLAAKVFEITGGSPLYIEELMVHLADTRMLVQKPETGWVLAVGVDEVPIPDSIIDLMSRRSADLGIKACDTLAVAALMGSTFDVEVLAAVVDEEMVQVLDVIDSAVMARLLRDMEPNGLCSFTDEISRAALSRHLRPGRRPLVHRQVAEAIEHLRPDRTEQLILHWSAAIGRDARAKAVHYLRLAGDRDMATTAWESAVIRQRRVLELLKVDGNEDLDLLGEARLALGSAQRLLGDDSYQPELTLAADLARRAGDPHRLFRVAAAMMRPGAWYPESGIVDSQIVAMCEDALLLLDDDDPIRPRVLAALATNLAYAVDPQPRANFLAEAQNLAKTSGDLGLIGTTLVAELISDQRPEAFERRREVANEVRRIGRATGDRDLLFTGSWFVMLGLLERGDVSSALALLDELRTLAEDKRDFFSRFLVSHADAALAIARSDADSADKVETTRAVFENEPIDSFAIWVIQTGTLAMFAGTLADLLVPIAQAADMWEEDWAQKWDYALAKAYLDTGDHDAALKTIRANPEPAPDSYWLSSYSQLAQVGLLLGLSDVCEAVIRRMSPFRGRLVLVGNAITVAGLASTALGQAHLGLGNLDDAEQLFRESVALADDAGFPYFATNARRFLAQTLLTRNPNEPEAAELLRLVLATSNSFDFGLERTEAERLLAQVQSVGDS